MPNYFNNEELCAGNGDSQPRILYEPTHPVTRNMSVVVGNCMNVTVGAPINKSETMISGETLDHLASFFNFSLDDFIVVANGSQQVLNQSSVIETSVSLRLYHNLTVPGVVSLSDHFEHGTPLAQIGNLSQFLNS